MKKVIVLGSSDLAQQLIFFIQEFTDDQIEGICDDYLTKNEQLCGLPVVGGVSELLASYKEHYVCVCIGYKNLQAKNSVLKRLIDAGALLYSFVHPSAIISSSAIIEEGAIIYPGCIIDQNVRIESGVLLNLGVTVSHDSRIRSCSFVAPRVTICGFCDIGASVFLGAGSVVADSVNIKAESKIGAGAIVVKNITNPGLYVGVPAERK